MFKWLLGRRASREQQVIERIRRHIGLLCNGCATFETAFCCGDRNLMRDIADMEREGDTVRREIIALISEGAFLPYLRPGLYRFVETVDDILDDLQETAQHFLDATIPAALVEECRRVAHLNRQMCEMLSITFEATLKGRDLREKTLAVRIYEKKIDDIKLGLLREARSLSVASYWEGESLSKFLGGLTEISNVIEDATDQLQMISVSMK